MAILAGAPAGAIAAVIFVVVALLLACLVLGVMAEREQRLVLFAAASVLAAMLGGVVWLSLAEGPPPAAREVEPPRQEKAAAPPAPTGNVVLIVDAATLPPAEEPEELSLERPESRSFSREQRQEAQRLGRQLRYIEQHLQSRLAALSADMQRIEQRFQAREIDNYDVLYQKGQLKARQAQMTAAAMEEKLQLLADTQHLTAADTEADRERVKSRLAQAQQKEAEYQAMLEELTANAAVFRGL